MGNYKDQQHASELTFKRAHLVLNALDIRETGLMDTLFLQLVLLDKEGVTKQFSTLGEQLSPKLQNIKVVSGSVVTANVHIGFGGLDPAVFGTAAVGFFEQRGPVLDGAKQVADVDEVEGVVIPCPAEAGVVDLELDIRGDPTDDVS